MAETMSVVALIREIARKEGVPQATVERVLGEAADEGLLRRMPDGAYEVTPAGRRRYAELARIFG